MTLRLLSVLFAVAVVGGAALPSAGQVHKSDEGRIPGVDFPDRYNIWDEPFPDRPVTPVAQAIRMGRGPIPMVLIPGVGGDWTVWRAFMDRNKDRYTMYALTLPGFGGSEPPPANPDDDFSNLPYLRNAVKAIVQFIDETGLEKPVLVGHGMGGHLAIWIGARYPDKTRAIVSVDGPTLVPLGLPEADDDRGLRREHIEVNMFRPLTMDSDADWFERMERTANDHVTDGARAQQIRRMYLSCYRGVYVMAQFEFLMSDLREPLAHMQVPTLVLAPCPPDAAGGPAFVSERWIKTLGDPANTTFLVVRDSRHFVMDDMPETLDDLTRRFVHGLPIDNAYVSVDGTAKPVNPELEKQAGEGEPKDPAPAQQP